MHKYAQKVYFLIFYANQNIYLYLGNIEHILYIFMHVLYFPIFTTNMGYFKY